MTVTKRHTMGNDFGGRPAANPAGAPRVSAADVRSQAESLGVEVKRDGKGWSMWWARRAGEEWRTLGSTNFNAREMLQKLFQPTPKPTRPRHGMLKALRYEILRNVEANGRKKIPMAEKPVRVATLIDEKAFNEDQLMVHHRTVFLEDVNHDYSWEPPAPNDDGTPAASGTPGFFRYYSRVAAVADVLVVYEIDNDYVPAPKFCGDTGKPLTPAAT